MRRAHHHERIRSSLADQHRDGFERIVTLRPERPRAGCCLIWLERTAVEQLRALRLKGEDLSDTIIRPAGIEAGRR